MNILVTGGLGFVGSNLVDSLIDSNHSVTVIDNLSSESSNMSNKNIQATYYIADIRDISTLNSLPKFDVIYHLAGLARIQPSFESPIDYISVNIAGTAAVCELARSCNAKLIYSSSSSINNGTFKTPYTFSKWGGEEVLKTWIQCYNLDAMMVRFYNVYGNREPETGDYATVVRKFIRQYKSDQPITIVGDGSQRRDFTNVIDIVSGLIKMMYNGEQGELYHLGRGVNFSIKELANMFPNADIEYVPLRKGEGNVTLSDYETTFSKLGWTAVNNLEDFIKGIL